MSTKQLRQVAFLSAAFFVSSPLIADENRDTKIDERDNFISMLAEANKIEALKVDESAKFSLMLVRDYNKCVNDFIADSDNASIVNQLSADQNAYQIAASDWIEQYYALVDQAEEQTNNIFNKFSNNFDLENLETELTQALVDSELPTQYTKIVRENTIKAVVSSIKSNIQNLLEEQFSLNFSTFPIEPDMSPIVKSCRDIANHQADPDKSGTTFSDRKDEAMNAVSYRKYLSLVGPDPKF